MWIKKTLLALSLSVLISFNFSSPVSYAKTKDNAVTACFKTYVGELSSFFVTIISFNGLTENFTEYYLDIFGRNSCHAYDIMALDSQLDNIKKQIQTAYLTCKKDKVPALTKSYFKTDAEIYYVRHVVKAPLFNLRAIIPAGFGYSALTDEEKQKLIAYKLAPYSDLHDAMKKKFSSRIGTEQDFENFFNQLEVKYSDRKASYVVCEAAESGWGAVAEKLNEFITEWGGAREGVEAVERDITDGAMRIKRSTIDMFPETWGNVFDNTFEMRINGVSPEKEISEILEESSSYGISVPNQKNVFNQVGTESERYDFEITEASLRAKYEALYLNTTDAALNEILTALDVLQSHIVDSEIQIVSMFQCATKIANKECPEQ